MLHNTEVLILTKQSTKQEHAISVTMDTSAMEMSTGHASTVEYGQDKYPLVNVSTVNILKVHCHSCCLSWKKWPLFKFARTRPCANRALLYCHKCYFTETSITFN